jgi:hypothetical protein
MGDNSGGPTQTPTPIYICGSVFVTFSVPNSGVSTQRSGGQSGTARPSRGAKRTQPPTSSLEKHNPLTESTGGSSEANA